MARYFFHIMSDGIAVPDEEGMELPDLLAAQAEAMASAHDLSRSADRDGFGKETRFVQIADALGTVLDSVLVPGNGLGVR